MCDEPRRVLLVEDHPGDARLVREELAEYGAGAFQLETVARLDTALRRLAEARFDAALLDLGLPDSQGLDTFARLHAAAPELPVVVLSGLADERTATEAVQAGAQDYLVKGRPDGHSLARALRYAIERGRAEQALRESEHRYRLLFDSGNDAVCVHGIGPDGLPGAFTQVNQILCQRLGYAAEEMLRMTPQQVRAPLPAGELECVMQRLRQDGQVLFEVDDLTRDGSRIPVEINARLIQLDGRPAVLSMARDIRERRRAEQGIRRANAELEQRVRERTAELEAFTYSVSHDLHAPLRHVTRFADMLRAECGHVLGSACAHYLDRIEAGAENMRRLIEALLKLSRLERQNLDRRPTDLNALLAGLLKELEPEFAARSIEWHIGSLPAADCDAGLLKQVFSNLLLNALKFTRPATQAVIEVGASRCEKESVFFVRDNGVGFDMQRAERLFGVFERLHPENEFEGTGIGLATVRRIVNRHGGRVWAEAAPGHGATFSFTLPPPA